MYRFIEVNSSLYLNFFRDNEPAKLQIIKNCTEYGWDECLKIITALELNHIGN